MFTIVDGDIFDCKEKYICHQCNCVTNRSAHMAKAVFDKFPQADIYSNRKEPDKPGQAIIVDCDDKAIVNLLGQYYPGRSRFPMSNSKDSLVARVDYFRKSLFDLSEQVGGEAFAFPWRIGCGAAGGDWAEYIEILKNFETYLNRAYGSGDITIYKLPENK